MATITIKIKRTKTFNDISVQMERIYTLNFNGYGSDRMLEKCEKIFSELLKKHGY